VTSPRSVNFPLAIAAEIMTNYLTQSHGIHAYSRQPRSRRIAQEFVPLVAARRRQHLTVCFASR